ncbi:thioredoxin family protein [Candidatus Dojkabacteria bacterium]|nr:thioredoxin family protein [Candidatus Dojkabacteria bacterium]
MKKKKIILYGALWCGDCSRAKFLLQKNNIEYEYIDIDHDEEAQEYVKKVNPDGNQSIPVIRIVGDTEKFLIEPSPAELEKALLDN